MYCYLLEIFVVKIPQFHKSDINGRPIYKQDVGDAYLFYSEKQIKWYIGSDVNKSKGWILIRSGGKKLIFKKKSSDLPLSEKSDIN